MLTSVICWSWASTLSGVCKTAVTSELLLSVAPLTSPPTTTESLFPLSVCWAPSNRERTVSLSFLANIVLIFFTFPLEHNQNWNQVIRNERCDVLFLVKSTYNCKCLQQQILKFFWSCNREECFLQEFWVCDVLLFSDPTNKCGEENHDLWWVFFQNSAKSPPDLT